MTSINGQNPELTTNEVGIPISFDIEWRYTALKHAALVFTANRKLFDEFADPSEDQSSKPQLSDEEIMQLLVASMASSREFWETGLSGELSEALCDSGRIPKASGMGASYNAVSVCINYELPEDSEKDSILEISKDILSEILPSYGFCKPIFRIS